MTDEPNIEDLIKEALSEPTFGPASDHDAVQYWANLARSLARAADEMLDDWHGSTGL